ncbi:MAG: hypothetical protein R3C16_06585 [Hyphomonadaceae bacterium]
MFEHDTIDTLTRQRCQRHTLALNTFTPAALARVRGWANIAARW